MSTMDASIDGSRQASTASPAASTLLVVDDQPVERKLTGRIVQKCTGLAPAYASGAREALAILESARPAAILTDMQMPGMSGLELVEAVRARFPGVPVIVMTAYGSEDLAVQALKAGASSYVPKRELERELGATLKTVLAVSEADGRRRRLVGAMRRRRTEFRLGNDPELLGPLVEHPIEDLGGLGFDDATARMRAGVALQEALANALYHGNLEVSSDLRQDDERVFYALAERRRGEEPYRGRAIEVHADIARGEARFTIRDEGPGFDTSRALRPVDPEDLMRIGGRGLLLIRTFMDEVTFNHSGNEITMTCRPGTTSRPLA